MRTPPWIRATSQSRSLEGIWGWYIMMGAGGSSYPSSYSSFSLILLVAPDLSVSSPIFKHPYTDLSSTGTMISLGRYGSCLRGYSATTPWVSFKYHPFSWPGSETLREQSVTADWVLGQVVIYLLYPTTVAILKASASLFVGGSCCCKHHLAVSIFWGISVVVRRILYPAP